MVMLRAGFSRTDITPCSREPGYAVHDPLLATVMVIADQGGHPLAALYTLDLTEIGVNMLDAVRADLAGRIGLAAERIVIHTTHTHSAPRSQMVDREMFTALLADAAREALHKTEPACITRARANVTGLSVCRRWDSGTDLGTVTIIDNERCHYADGRVHVRDYVIAELEELGVTNIPPIPADAVLRGPDDNELDLTLFRRPSGEPLGTIIRFSAHVDQLALRDGTLYSAEYPAPLRGLFEKEIGGTALFLNGPCGDIKPLYREYTWEECVRIGEGLAREAVRLAGKAPAAVPLETAAVRSTRLELPMRTDIPRDPYLLVQEMFRLKWERRARLARGTAWEEMRPWDNHRWVIDTMAYFAHSDRDNVRMLQADAWPFHAALIDLNGTVRYVCLQDEIFGRFTRELRAGITDPEKTVTVSLCNGGNWYLAPADEQAKLGYEPTCSLYGPGAYAKCLAGITAFVNAG